jgi:hypothetical protein
VYSQPTECSGEDCDLHSCEKNYLASKSQSLFDIVMFCMGIMRSNMHPELCKKMSQISEV